MPERGALYKYICDNVIPGCDHEVDSESRDELMGRVEKHLSGYHEVDPRDRAIEEAVRTRGITLVRPI